MNPQGYFSIVLHAHLPFVCHPEHEDFLEEDWYFEAVTETYLPLLRVFRGLQRDGVSFRISMVLTPTLVSMFNNPLLRSRYCRWIGRKIELAEKELKRTQPEPHLHMLAGMYHGLFHACRHEFEDEYGYDLTGAFRQLQDAGVLEILTCAATHGFLPLLQPWPRAVRAQIRVAAEHYRDNFGRDPRGIWLPECGYFVGLDEALAEENIRYFIVDTHGLLNASPRPLYGTFAPVFCPTGVAAFGRDLETSKQVWSKNEGYPGDFWYREFYRDVGFDLDWNYVRPYIQPTGERKLTGVKYYRITGKSDYKEWYEPDRARDRAAEHAANFMFNRERQIEWVSAHMDGHTPIVLAPYDAELFGHWWFEGPQFLDFFIRKTAFDQRVFALATPSEYLERFPTQQLSVPSPSSWGWRGYNEVWLEGSNDWIYRHLHCATRRMLELADRFPDAQGLQRRALNQAARELLLAQASDWAFIMKTKTAVDYAVRRQRDHLLAFQNLYQQLLEGEINFAYLLLLEGRENIFPRLDYRAYC